MCGPDCDNTLRVAGVRDAKGCVPFISAFFGHEAVMPKISCRSHDDHAAFHNLEDFSAQLAV